MRWLPTLFQHPYADRMLTEFRGDAYLRANPDVAAAAHDDAAALRHFYYRGYYERRIFDAARLIGFDPGFYRERYPELGLIDDAEAQIHYHYIGYYEGRVPSRDTAWYLDADLHVFQMGKVGSHAIAQALESSGSARQVIQLHWMADFHLQTPGLRLPYRQLLLHPRERPVQVLSGTREIVSWALASLFQYFGSEFNSLSQARAMVEERFVETCEAGLSWFDHQYYCGLDVYAHAFPHEKGAVRIRHAPIDLVVYRQEDLPRLSDTLGEFMSIPEFQIGRANTGGAKEYSELYHSFLRDARFPGNLLARLYDSPLMRHFYSDAEREQAYQRWLA
ncbi:putative capsular polysaccharide synthesis family protein [Arenimonas alkanexedens]